MLDPIQLPILLKAIDFIFEEGRKILEERRERRKMSVPAQSSESPEPAPEVPEAAPAEVQENHEIKQDLLTSKIDEILWQDHELEVKHLVKLLETYSRNYHLASEQYAKWGSALVPPIIVHNMTEAENSMVETLKQLEAVVSKVYKKDINPNQ
ncbi:MAG TPA: hypothetical protein VMN99_00115 [Anaerolineales bacterium]|nr:hypothetical protein [Anaerolineales bacterium]